MSLPLVSALVRRTVAGTGAQGRAWLASLPTLVDALAGQWGLRVVGMLDGGSWSCVLQVETDDGTSAVLKVAPPHTDLATSAAPMVSADGRGYALVLAQDARRNAVLMEALGPSLHTLGWPAQRQLETLCHTLLLVWQPPPEVVTREVACAKANGLADLVADLWEQLDRPCAQALIEHALEFARRRAEATDAGHVVVVHGDPHPGNLLQVGRPREGAETGFVFVDPDGFVADPAYDLGVAFRDWCTELLTAEQRRSGSARDTARTYCRLLADCATAGGWAIDETAIWEWGLLERVSTGLYVTRYADAELGSRFLRTAQLLV